MTNQVLPLDQIWDSIRTLFNEACHSNHLNKTEEASFILQKELPLLITAWKSRCQLSEQQANAKLKSLFTNERQLVANTYILRKSIIAAATERYAREGWSEEYSAPVEAKEKTTRIQVDDVAGMIDAVQVAHFISLQQTAA